MREIKLSFSKHGQFFAKVDDSDFEWLNQWKWYARKNGDYIYAARGEGDGPKIIHMSRFILGITDSNVLADHGDRDTLNNQRNNLRIANKSQNCSNQRKAKNKTSQYLGVSKHKRGKWVATAGHKMKSVYIGIFDTEEEAAIAYNKKAIELHGEFANLNKI